MQKEEPAVQIIEALKQLRRMSKSTTSIVTDINDKDNHFPDSKKEDITTSPVNKHPVNIRPRWTHNPMVLSMLACSNMHDCEEVKEIYRECQANHSDSMMCEAAEKYYKMCHENGNILNECPYYE